MIQCTHGCGDGASGSSQIIASDTDVSGTPEKLRAGDTSAPCAVNFAGMGASGSNASVEICNVPIVFSPPSSGDDCSLPLQPPNTIRAAKSNAVNVICNLGLATDGDGDRLGAMDALGNFVDPHHIFALALQYLVEKRGWSGTVVRSVSTTRMVDRLASRYGLPLVETPVGFNYISDLMLQEPVLIGGEESGGISIQGHIPEGDGILMGLLLTEIIASSGRSLDE